MYRRLFALLSLVSLGWAAGCTTSHDCRIRLTDATSGEPVAGARIEAHAVGVYWSNRFASVRKEKVEGSSDVSGIATLRLKTSGDSMYNMFITLSGYKFVQGSLNVATGNAIASYWRRDLRFASDDENATTVAGQVPGEDIRFQFTPRGGGEICIPMRRLTEFPGGPVPDK